MVNVEWNAEKIAQSETGAAEMFAQQISVMEGDEALAEVEYRIEQKEATK